jgi:large subunit ribosomal protein L32
MPPLPKRKYPKARQGKRRSHLKVTPPHVIECPRCRNPRLSHTACPSCGTYQGRDVMNLPGPELDE